MAYGWIRRTTTRCACDTFVYTLNTLFNSSTVGYNTLQQQAKYPCLANPLFIDRQNNTLKTFTSPEELTFFTILYIKQYTPLNATYLFMQNSFTFR